jgi:D-arabinose 1-dehydrogenase-like Zn-dependent alcohol dehydrogenase
MQFALAHGMQVCVTSGNEEKQTRATALGVACAANYHDANWSKDLLKTFGEFDLVLDSAGGEGFNQLQRLVKPGGRMVVYGGTLGKISHLSPHLLYWRQMTVRGSTMGSQKDFAEMLAFVEKHQIKPVVDSIFDLEHTNAALEKLRDGTQFGKVVIRISA